MVKNTKGSTPWTLIAMLLALVLIVIFAMRTRCTETFVPVPQETYKKDGLYRIRLVRVFKVYMSSGCFLRKAYGIPNNVNCVWAVKFDVKRYSTSTWSRGAGFVFPYVVDFGNSNEPIGFTVKYVSCGEFPFWHAKKIALSWASLVSKVTPLVSTDTFNTAGRSLRCTNSDMV